MAILKSSHILAGVWRQYNRGNYVVDEKIYLVIYLIKINDGKTRALLLLSEVHKNTQMYKK